MCTLIYSTSYIFLIGNSIFIMFYNYFSIELVNITLPYYDAISLIFKYKYSDTDLFRINDSKLTLEYEPKQLAPHYYLRIGPIPSSYLNNTNLNRNIQMMFEYDGIPKADIIPYQLLYDTNALNASEK